MSCPVSDAEIHQGALAPYAFRYDATSEDAASFDLSTVTSASFEVTRENGNTDSWTAAVSNQATTTLRLTHVFVAGDVDQLETLIVTPIMASPSGAFYAESRRLRVRPLREM